MRRFLQRFWQKFKKGLRGEKFLCDSCKYNWREACSRPERPNAKECPDYKSRRQ